MKFLSFLYCLYGLHKSKSMYDFKQLVSSFFKNRESAGEVFKEVFEKACETTLGFLIFILTYDMLLLLPDGRFRFDWRRIKRG